MIEKKWKIEDIIIENERRLKKLKMSIIMKIKDLEKNLKE